MVTCQRASHMWLKSPCAPGRASSMQWSSPVTFFYLAILRCFCVAGMSDRISRRIRVLCGGRENSYLPCPLPRLTGPGRLTRCSLPDKYFPGRGTPYVLGCPTHPWAGRLGPVSGTRCGGHSTCGVRGFVTIPINLQQKRQRMLIGPHSGGIELGPKVRRLGTG